MRMVIATAGAVALSVGLVVAGDQAATPAAPKVAPAAAPAKPQSPATSARPAPVAAHAATAKPNQPAAAGMTAEAQTALVKQYCVGCHNDRNKERVGNLSLAAFDAAAIVDNAAVGEKMIRKLRAGMMPPPGAKRPEPAVLAEFAGALETRIDRAAALAPNPGFRPFQRANRAEYAHAVSDLLGIDVDVHAFLPPDTISNGFDNVADSQAMSPTLMEGYLRTASQIARLAVGDRSASATSVTYKIPRARSQMWHVEGTPMGTRGGLSTVHIFPADGEYVFKAALHYQPLGGLVGSRSMSTFNLEESIEVSIDGERVGVLALNTRMNESDPKNNLEPQTAPVHVKAGPHRVSAAFISQFEAIPDDLVAPLENSLADVDAGQGITLLPHLRELRVIGPSL